MCLKAWSALTRIPWWVWVIALVALVPRLLLVPYGLPYEFDPDERLSVDAAWRMVESGTGDPSWYSFPAATLFDAMAVLYWLYGLVGVLSGGLGSIAEAGEAYRSDISHFFAIGRMVAAIGGVGIVLVAYALARELRVHVFWAAVTATLLAVSFAMIELSALVRPDTLMTMFLLAVVAVSVRALEAPSARIFALAGALLGLAAASKSPGAIAIVPVVAANVTLVAQRRITPRRGLQWLSGSALAAAAAVAIVAPYLYLNLIEVIGGSVFQARLVHLGATGAGPVGNLWGYLTEALPRGLGGIATIAGVLGLLLMLPLLRPRMVSITFWVFLFSISVVTVWWLRWALPLLPLAAVGAAFLLEQVDVRLRSRHPGHWIWAPRGLAAAILLWPLVSQTVDDVRFRAANDDTRLRAIEWVQQNVPDGSALLVDANTTQLSLDRYDVVTIDDGELVHWGDVDDRQRPDGYFTIMAFEWNGAPGELIAAMEAEGIDYMVLNELWIDQLRAEADAYPDQLALYEALLETFPVIETFDREDAPVGWTLTVHEVAGVRVDLQRGLPRDD